jgi:hypothetical protein
MAFQVSPGVVTKEIDLTLIVPAVATTIAGFSGRFEWGPADQIVIVDSENQLAGLYGKPTLTNYVDFFTAANFLGYGRTLKVNRYVETTAANADSAGTGTLIKNSDAYQDGTYSPEWIARYPGSKGDSLKVAWNDGGGDSTLGGITWNYRLGVSDVVGMSAGFSAGILSSQALGGMSLAAGVTVSAAGASWAWTGEIDVASGTVVDVTTISGSIASGATGPLYAFAAYSAVSGVTLGDNVAMTGVTTPAQHHAGIQPVVSSADYDNWEHADQFDLSMPFTTQWFEDTTGSTVGHDGVNILVLDQDGDFSGVKGTVLERFEGVSKAANAKKYNGESNYYKDIINNSSKYIYWGADPTVSGVTNAVTGGAAWSSTVTTSSGNFAVHYSDGATSGFNKSLSGGSGGVSLTRDTIPTSGSSQGYAIFSDPETVDVNLLIAGANDGATTLPGGIVDICDARKDCVVFLSPNKDDVVANGNPVESSTALTNILQFRNSELNKASSYAFMDSGWKYMYDRYNDVYIWTPLCADIAGIAVRSDEATETWFSPAGFNRGQVRGVIKLSFNPTLTQRDSLYKDQVNPVVAFPGEGTVLFGDKTLQSKPSAFDRINVRRLFIVLEKAIATASKFQLFEQNDAFTRAQFKNLIEPFLRDVQSRRGIIDFKVVCDESNNTGEIIDRNEFIADIFIKPTRSINFITLNFIAARTGIDFSEIGGV